ncbi:MAG: toxin-antitoxin system HicB family antitoxin [Trueperaceae bacterium]
MTDTISGGVSPSGRFMLRIAPSLHASLRKAAQQAGLSLNDLCARRLAAPITDAGGPGAAIAARAAGQFGDSLCGVIAHGSWARDELASDSDVDVLIVVDDEVRITRDLYRAWDDRTLTWHSRDVDVHFAHSPGSGEQPGGIWLEVAIDGVVLFDRDLRLSRTLAEIRSLVAAGRIARHRAHGQSYWVEAR